MLSQYLRKKADVPFISTMTATSGAVKDLFLYAAATAGLAGLGTGYSLSRLSSPRPADIENERKQYLLTDAKLRLAKYKKERGLANPHEDTDVDAGAKPPREIRL